MQFFKPSYKLPKKQSFTITSFAFPEMPSWILAKCFEVIQETLFKKPKQLEELK